MFLQSIISIILGVITVVYSTPQDRIVGGSFQFIGSAAFQVAIFPGEYLCGGAILNKNWMVSAAHCTDGYVAAQVQFAYGIQDISEITKYLDISRIVQHGSYNPKTKDSDIVLLKSASVIIFSPTVQPIPLQTVLPADDSVVTVSGYGNLASGGKTSEVLMSVNLYIVNNADCNDMYGGGINKNMICAGIYPYDKVDSCQGDSGGPLTIDGTLVGVVSAGYGCADGLPGFYTSVPEFCDWINPIIVQ